MPGWEEILRRDRFLVVAGVGVLCALSWLYLADQASAMAGMPEVAGMAGAWGLRDLGYLAVMWSVMMVAMMLPSATPTLLLFASLQRSRRERAREAAPAAAPITAFVLGYLLVWTAYGVGAAVAQWLLHRALLVSAAMVSASPWVSGGLLLAAGAYQFTPLKGACIGHCRSPISFFGSHWREGTAGAVRMGAHHGTYCVGCCWALMALLFVLGVMNLFWVLALALLVLAEKAFPGGVRISRVAGVAFLAWGGWVLLGAAGTV